MKYRDKLTGHYVRKSTWTRSKAHGGSRYVRIMSTPKGGKHGPDVAPKGTIQQKHKHAPVRRKSGAGGSSTKEAPAPEKIKTPKDYYDNYYLYDEYEDAGEVETGIDY